jgi:hypothetical protein
VQAVRLHRLGARNPAAVSASGVWEEGDPGGRAVRVADEIQLGDGIAGDDVLVVGISKPSTSSVRARTSVVKSAPSSFRPSQRHR